MRSFFILLLFIQRQQTRWKSPGFPRKLRFHAIYEHALRPKTARATENTDEDLLVSSSQATWTWWPLHPWPSENCRWQSENFRWAWPRTRTLHPFSGRRAGDRCFEPTGRFARGDRHRHVVSVLFGLGTADLRRWAEPRRTGSALAGPPNAVHAGSFAFPSEELQRHSAPDSPCAPHFRDLSAGEIREVEAHQRSQIEKLPAVRLKQRRDRPPERCRHPRRRWAVSGYPNRRSRPPCIVPSARVPNSQPEFAGNCGRGLGPLKAQRRGGAPPEDRPLRLRQKRRRSPSKGPGTPHVAAFRRLSRARRSRDRRAIDWLRPLLLERPGRPPGTGRGVPFRDRQRDLAAAQFDNDVSAQDGSQQQQQQPLMSICFVAASAKQVIGARVAIRAKIARKPNSILIEGVSRSSCVEPLSTVEQHADLSSCACCSFVQVHFSCSWFRFPLLLLHLHVRSYFSAHVRKRSKMFLVCPSLPVGPSQSVPVTAFSTKFEARLVWPLCFFYWNLLEWGDKAPLD